MTSIKLTSEQLVDRAARYLWAEEGFKQAVYLDRKDSALEAIRAVVRQAVEDATKNEKDRILKIVRETHPADGVEGCGCAGEITKRARRKAKPISSESTLKDCPKGLEHLLDRTPKKRSEID